ncbi:hypothetical protein BYT27DRAFT_7114957 [Phlegmacium glaucopus]|nr:hypothetical protein BYT27DRAFT_7114957 [Phlegmacium glaucopus]
MTYQEGNITSSFPGYEQFSNELSTLLYTYPPPFIYIHDSEAFKSTCWVVNSILKDICGDGTPPSSPSSYSSLFSASGATTNPFIIHSTKIDAISTFTSRLLFEAVINSLAGWEVKWEDGCSNWHSNADEDGGRKREGEAGGGESRWNENVDTFIHGLRAVHGYLCRRYRISMSSKAQGKGKEKANQNDTTNSTYENVRVVIVIEHAERLKETIPELVVPLTRLAEMAQLDITVIFISRVGWETIRPSLGASPDPYYMDIPPPSKENVVKYLTQSFTSLSQSPQVHTSNERATSTPITPYHPSLAPLYTHFTILLTDICFPFIHNPYELQYIAAARWPGFVKPVLDEYEGERDADGDVDMDTEDAEEEEEGNVKNSFALPSEDTRMRLNRLFNSSLTNALEALHPRLTNATDWAQANEPEANLLLSTQLLPHHLNPNVGGSSSAPGTNNSLKSLSRISKFILVASFLASTNPPKSDMRMFGRGLDEKKRKKRMRRVGQGGRKTTTGGGAAAAKVPQRLLGPVAFALDRMIAILGALLEENDIDGRFIPRQFSIPGEFTDMEISRVGVFSAIMELTSMRLLHRTSATDRLDGPPMFKCAISYDATLTLAKQLTIPLNDLLWDEM